METVLREACDNCHRRKTRCPSDGGGPCTNCRASGQVCTFSPRSRIGRPRVRPSRSKRNRTRTPSLTQTDGDNNAGSHIPTVFDPIPGYTTPVPSIMLGGADGGNASLPDETTLASDPSYMHSPWESALEPFPMSLTEPLIPFDNEFPFFSPDEVDSLCKSPSLITENEISQRDLVFLSPNKNLSVPRTTTSPVLVPEQQPQQSYMEDRPECKGKSLITVYGQLSQLLFTLHLAHDTFCRGEKLGISDRSSIEQIFSTVSSLCDVVSWLSQSAPSASDPTLSLSPCPLLIISMISTVVEIYQRVLDSGLRPSMGLMQPPSSSRSALPSPPISITPRSSPFLEKQPADTHTRLRCLSDGITMDFHLSLLEGIFGWGCSETNNEREVRRKLENTHKELQVFMEEWKKVA